MADASADVADPVDRARERLEQAVTHLEAVCAGMAEKHESGQRENQSLSVENAELRRTRDGTVARDALIVQRLGRAIERLRATIEGRP